MSSISKNIKRLREIYGLTQQDLADIAGVTNKAVSAWENGSKEPRMGAIEKMAQRYGILKSNIIEENGMENLHSDKKDGSRYSSAPLVPLVGTICAGDGLLAEQNIEDYILYPFPSKRQPDFSLRVKGDSMIGVGIEDGDIVYMRKAEWADYNGQVVAAIINDGEDGTLKRIRWSNESPVIQLVPENDLYETIEVMPNQVRITGVYVGHFKYEREV